jgi:hypothetical protein
MGTDWGYGWVKPGEGVWCEMYGYGVVHSINDLWLWIVWERYGQMNHQPSFARWIEPAED